MAEAKALYDEGLLTFQAYDRVMEEGAEAMDQVGESGVISAKLVKDSFADALESATFDFENFGDAANNVLEGIARNVARQQFIDPLSNAAGGLIGSLFGGGGAGRLIDNAGAYLGLNASYGPAMQGFAEGGSPPVGVPSIVGERGPEIFVPNAAGTIIPNGGMGGTSVTVQQNIYLSPGIQGTVEAEVRRAAPSIAALAKQEVFNSILRGGAERRIISGAK